MSVNIKDFVYRHVYFLEWMNLRHFSEIKPEKILISASGSHLFQFSLGDPEVWYPFHVFLTPKGLVLSIDFPFDTVDRVVRLDRLIESERLDYYKMGVCSPFLGDAVNSSFLVAGPGADKILEIARDESCTLFGLDCLVVPECVLESLADTFDSINFPIEMIAFA